MARPRNKTNARYTRDAERLVALSLALNGSGSRVEDRYWEREIETLLAKLLHAGQDGAVEAALDALLETDAGGYEILVEQAETLSESTFMEKDGESYDVLLVVAPVVAWTRFTIPSGRIRQESLDALSAHLHGHILATDVRLALASELYSVDQMPRSFSATLQWLMRLGARALDLPVPRSTLAASEVPNLLADTRYVVGAVAVPRGKPVFRWQEGIGGPGAAAGATNAGRDECLDAWVAQATPIFADLLPGCGFECLLPDAYYVNNREADRRVRPLSMQAAVSWIETALNMPPAQLRAVIAGCGETDIEEYRVGFTARNRNDVIYGATWPVFGRDDDTEESPTIEQIASILKELGVDDIRRLPGLMPLEFCEDCGAPYFPNPLGEMVHAEPPEEADTSPTHFH
jgi:hypothetical protein